MAGLRLGSSIRRRGQEDGLQAQQPHLPPPHNLAVPPPHSSPPPVAPQQAGAATMAATPAPPVQQQRGAAADPAAELFPSPSSWRAQPHRALKGKLFTLANLWTCALVATVLLALIFRAMQPTEEPTVGIMYYEWELDPTNDRQVRLAVLELEAKGIGRFATAFAPAKVVIRNPPPAPARAEERNNATGEGDPMPPMPILVSFLEEDVLALVEIPAWGIRDGNNGVMVTSEQHSGYFPYRPDTQPEVILTAVFDGSVTVFAALPARIYMVCRVKASATGNEAPECFSRYMPRFQRGADPLVHPPTRG